MRWTATFACLLTLAGCQASAPSARPPSPTSAPAATERPPAPDPAEERARINAVVDDWHRAAAEADETRYFDHMTEDAIFLGTDASERWDKTAFRGFAHPFFARGRAWTFTPVRRDVILAEGAIIAWFDEDLATPNLGPSRGSGVVIKQGTVWRIAHYNLALTIPNDALDAVKAALSAQAAGSPADSTPTDGTAPPDANKRETP